MYKGLDKCINKKATHHGRADWRACLMLHVYGALKYNSELSTYALPVVSINSNLYDLIGIYNGVGCPIVQMIY